MKNAKKFVALFVAVLMVMALCVPAFAANGTTTTGSIKLTNPVEGRTYTAYKIFDYTYDDAKSAHSYTISSSSAWLTPIQTFISTYPECGLELVANSGSTEYTVLSETGFQNYVALFAKYLNANLPTGASGTVLGSYTDSTTGDAYAMAIGLDLGYYLVSAGSTLIANLTNTDPNAIVKDKNETPETEKFILEGTNELKENDAAIGDTITFEIKTKIPDVTGYSTYFFVVNDTMSKGLTFNDDIVVKIDGTTVSGDDEYTATDVYNYVVTTTDDNETLIRIIFNNMVTNYSDPANVGKPIVITYSATLNEDANVDYDGDASAEDSNPNTSSVTYSNDPSVTPTHEPTEGNPNDPENPGYVFPEDPTGTGGEDQTDTYTTGLKIKKIDGDTSNPLTGAKFKIEGDSTTGTAGKTIIGKGYNFYPLPTATYIKYTDTVETPAGPTGYITVAPQDSTLANYDEETPYQQYVKNGSKYEKLTSSSATLYYKLNAAVTGGTYYTQVVPGLLYKELYEQVSGKVQVYTLSGSTYTNVTSTLPDIYYLLKNGTYTTTAPTSWNLSLYASTDMYVEDTTPGTYKSYTMPSLYYKIVDADADGYTTVSPNAVPTALSGSTGIYDTPTNVYYKDVTTFELFKVFYKLNTYALKTAKDTTRPTEQSSGADVEYIKHTGDDEFQTLASAKSTLYYQITDSDGSVSYTVDEPFEKITTVPTDIIQNYYTFDSTTGIYTYVGNTAESVASVTGDIYKEVYNVKSYEGYSETASSKTFDIASKKYYREEYVITTETSTTYAEAFVDDKGVLVFGGLKEGKYTITEIVVPDGYNPIDPIKLNIVFVPGTPATSSSAAVDPQFYIEELYDANDPSSEKTMTIDVINVKGTQLPETGGVGTTLFITFGALAVMFAGVLLVTNKRISKETI